jgi:subtilisin family serine protease
MRLTSLGIAAGGSSVIVAVLDDSFDLNHPDLAHCFTPLETHFNATESANVVGVTPGNMNAGPGPGDMSGHGTQMAGLIAASPAASGGARGIAAGCKIMPLRLGSVQDLTDSDAQFALSSGLGVAGGIRWATDHGARVLNMSFDWESASVITDALEYANANNVVLCAAAGNVGVAGSPQVAYPAREKSVIAVGAVDRDLTRHAPTSHDGDNNLGETWSSQYDSGVPQMLSLVAPGVRCWTTDARNPRGENQSGGEESAPAAHYTCAGDPAGNYYALGRGTSIATAHVSALAARILARKPGLTNAEVRQIIERTCQRVTGGGAYVYVQKFNKLNGDWNDEVGYGLIDATAAFNDPLIMP